MTAKKHTETEQRRPLSGHEAAQEKADRMRKDENRLPVDPYPLNQERERKEAPVPPSPAPRRTTKSKGR